MQTVVHAEVVIVGGGVLGVSLAYELARRTFRVILLEARQLGSGATGGGFAWVNATSKTEDESYHRLNAQAVAHLNSLAATFGRERLGLYAGGSLSWARGADTAGCEVLRQRAARLQQWGYPATLLNGSEVQALEPGIGFPEGDMDGVEGLFAPADRWLQTPRFLHFLAGLARERSADIREYCSVTGFTQSVVGGISTIETEQGRIGSRLVILAAGAQTPALAALACGLPPDRSPFPVLRRPGLLVETPPDSAPALVHRVLYPPDTGGLHLRPTSTGGLLLGADDTDALVTDDLGVPIPPDAPRSLLERAARFFPQLPVPALQDRLAARVCVRPFPPDERPILGPVPQMKGLYAAVTHSGVTLGPWLAHLLAEEIVSGRAAPQLAAYRPDRFLPGTV